MASGLLFVDSVVGHTSGPLVTLGLVAAAGTGVAFAARGKLAAVKTPLVPEAGLSLRNVFEILAGFMLWLGDTAMGKENRRYLPFCTALFFFVFTANLIGLVPGFVMPTDQLQINLGIGLVVFALYNYWGVKEIGFKAYFKHLCGPVWWLAPLLLIVELIGHFVRPITLGLRLFGNMLGDHVVLGVFTDLTKGTALFFVPVAFYILGTVVCFVQAFVFTLLTMIYIRLAVAHGDDH